MPRREDIERFAQVLNSLGDEPAIRAARSETIEEVPAPAEAGAEEAAGAEAADLDSLGLDAEPGAEAESLQDIFSSLSGLAEEDTSGGGTGGPGGPGVGEPGGTAEPGAEELPPPGAGGAETAEGLDFASLFGEEPSPEGIEDLGTPAPRPPAARKAPAAPPAEAAAGEEAFSFPEGEPESLGSDLAAFESLPDETVEPPAAGEPLEDLGSFSLPEESGAAAAEEPSEAGGAFDIPSAGAEAAGSESFELPNLDDLSFSEQAEPAGEAGPESAEPSEPSFELPAEPAFDQPEPTLEPSAAESSEFELPAEPSSEPFAEPTGAEPGPTFDLDSAAFEVPGGEAEAPSEEMPSPEFAAPSPAPGGEESGAGLEGLGEESLGDLDLDSFSLPDSAEQFGVQGLPGGEQAPVPEPPARPKAAERKGRPAARAPEAPVEELGGAELPEGAIELTPEQFARLKSTLASLPRNLKIAVQDLIGEGMVSGPDLSALITLLLRGAAAQEIATLASRISGKRIRIPAGYEKKSGQAFEAEQRTFAYAFRENYLPLLRVVALTVIVGALFGFLGYNYIYRPLFAWTNYRAGYAQIANDRFTLANERFARATSVWPLKQWYYRYAEGFAGKRNYPLAEQKYDELLKSWPLDKKGTLDYARLESDRLADYEKADSLLTRYLDAHPKDYDAMLAAGDNDLAWAARVDKKYEAARLAYATLLQDYGIRDELLFRMLRYFIRTDKGGEVERLRAYYAARPEVKVDGAAFAEMGGYLVDHRRLDFVQEVLFRADKSQPGLPDVHYNLARYYRIVQNAVDEKKALDATATLLERTKSSAPFTTHRLGVEIDTHTRLGEYYYKTQQYIPAERELQDAIRLVETYQQQKIIDKDPLYGRPYAVLGDLSYYIEDNLPSAALSYQKAADNLYSSPLLTYKIGYVQYFQKDYKGALDSFSRAEDASVYPSSAQDLELAAVGAPTARGSAAAPPGASAQAGSAQAGTSEPAATPVAQSSIPSTGEPPQNLLYALGDTFYQRGDYFAAQASFLRLRERMESRRAGLGILHPEDRADDRAFLDTLVRVNNNLGVTMARLAAKTGDRRKRSEALVYLSEANEIASSLARSPDTVKRSEDRNVPSLNMKEILFPVPGSDLQIYSGLPKDFQSVTW
jgi:hypothetical protein